MNFPEFFQQSHTPSYVQFAANVGIGSDGPVRAWAAGRGRPHVEWAARAEAASGFKVMRWDLYPDNWWLIWPELVGHPKAPALPEGAPLVPKEPTAALQALA